MAESEVQPTVEVSLDVDAVEFRDGNLKRDRPFGESRRSTASTKSVVSQNPNVVTSPFTAANLFAYRQGAIDTAVQHCKTSIVKNDLDGDVIGSWLLTEIDHWDLEKEKLVILTSNSVLVIHYDFIRHDSTAYRRILLKTVKRIQIGDIQYPSLSLMPARQHGAVRIFWNVEEPSFAQRWNPMCSDLGFVTLTHHLLAYKPDERETVTFDVADMVDSVTMATNNLRRSNGEQENVIVENSTISVESYGSVMSLIYNQSHIGFNMCRGGISF